MTQRRPANIIPTQKIKSDYIKTFTPLLQLEFKFNCDLELKPNVLALKMDSFDILLCRLCSINSNLACRSLPGKHLSKPLPSFHPAIMSPFKSRQPKQETVQFKGNVQQREMTFAAFVVPYQCAVCRTDHSCYHDYHPQIPASHCREVGTFKILVTQVPASLLVQ